MSTKLGAHQTNPFKYFKTSPEIIKLTVWYRVRFGLSLRQVEDILHERGIDICHETVRFWVDRFGPLFTITFNINVISKLAQHSRNFAINHFQTGGGFVFNIRAKRENRGAFVLI